MTAQDYLRVLHERWKLVAIAVVLGLVAATATFLLRPAEYTASSALYVSAQMANNTQDAYQGAQLSEQRVKSYNELATGDRVLGETIRRLGLDTTPEDLASEVTATSPLDSVVITISATDRSPDRAAAISNTVSAIVSDLVVDIERPSSPNGVAPVTVRLVQPARVPDEPSSIGLPMLLVLGLLGGVALGVSAAFVRNAFDTTVRNPDDLAALADTSNLGVVVHDPTTRERPLVLYDDPQSRRAECYRQLRTNLRFVDLVDTRKVLLVTSAAAEEGKTTTVANLALALSSMGSRVLVIEADLRRPKLSRLLGLDRSVGLTRVLFGRLTLAQAVQPWGAGAFDVLSSGPTPPNPGELLGSSQMVDLLQEARARYDRVLIDSPPLLPVTDAVAVAPATDGAVLVCRFNSTTRDQVRAAVQALRAVAVTPLGTVLSMVPEKGPMAYGRYGTYYTADVDVSPIDPADMAPVRPGDLHGRARTGMPVTGRPVVPPHGLPGRPPVAPPPVTPMQPPPARSPVASATGRPPMAGTTNGMEAETVTSVAITPGHDH